MNKNELIEKISKKANSLQEDSNATFHKVTNQLILVSTVILTFSSSLIAKQLLDNLNNIYKTILVFTWIFLGVSIIAGIIQFIVDHYYYSRRADSYFNIAQKISDSKENDDHKLWEIVQNGQLELQENSSDIPFWLQFAFFFISLILILIVSIKSLYL